MKIQVLGSGCPTCKRLHESVVNVVSELGLKQEVEYSTDILKIVELGAMSSPVLAINGKVVASGRVPSNQEIKAYITASNEIEEKPFPQKNCCNCHKHNC